MTSERVTPHRRAHETDVDPPGFERLDLRARGQLLQPHHHQRMGVAEGPNDRRQRAVAGRADEPDGQRAGVTRGGVVHRSLQPVGLAEQWLRQLQQQPAGVGQSHTAAVALEQCHPEFGLQTADLLAQR